MKIWLVLTALLAGCQTTQAPEGPCQRPPSLLQLGTQTWSEPGQKTWDTRQVCLANGGTYQSPDRVHTQRQVQVAADQGDPRAWLQLGQWAMTDQPPRFAFAEQAFLQAWTRGLDEAAWYLSRLERHGYGRTPDPLAATNWLQKASGDQTLVPARDLASVKIQRQHLTDRLHQTEAEMAALNQQILAAPPGTTLFRFDLGGQGGCGTDLDWQAFGTGPAGLSLAIDAFVADYQDRGWLWLDLGPGNDDPLTKSVLNEVLQSAPIWLIATGFPGQHPDSPHPRIFSTQSPADGGHRFGPNQIVWNCSNA